LSIASNLLFESGFGGMKKGKLYSAMLDHIIKKVFNGRTLSEADLQDIEYAIENMQQIRKNFSKPIVAGILKEG